MEAEDMGDQRIVLLDPVQRLHIDSFRRQSFSAESARMRDRPIRATRWGSTGWLEAGGFRFFGYIHSHFWGD